MIWGVFVPPSYNFTKTFIRNLEHAEEQKKPINSDIELGLADRLCSSHQQR